MLRSIKKPLHTFRRALKRDLADCLTACLAAKLSVSEICWANNIKKRSVCGCGCVRVRVLLTRQLQDAYTSGKREELGIYIYMGGDRLSKCS